MTTPWNRDATDQDYLAAAREEISQLSLIAQFIDAAESVAWNPNSGSAMAKLASAVEKGRRMLRERAAAEAKEKDNG